MSHDPYSVPSSPLGSTRKPAPVKAVIYGLMIDVGGSLLFGLVFGLAYGAILAANGVSADEIMAKLSDMDPRSLTGFILNLAGLLFSFLGGYVCARTAVERVYACVAVMVVIEIVISIFSMDDEASIRALIIALMAAVVFLGAYVQQRRLRAGLPGLR